jgi:hypothetical protein
LADFFSVEQHQRALLPTLGPTGYGSSRIIVNNC